MLRNISVLGVGNPSLGTGVCDETSSISSWSTILDFFFGYHGGGFPFESNSTETFSGGEASPDEDENLSRIYG